MRLMRAGAGLAVAVALGLGGTPAVAAEQAEAVAPSCFAAGATPGRSQEAVHVDTIARFGSGRVICATAAVESFVESAMVRARISVFALNAQGSMVPGVYRLETFQLRYANCSASGCGSGKAFTRCSPTACTSSTTSADPIATFVGVYHDSGKPYAGNTGWRTRGERLKGDIKSTGDKSDYHCVSSGVWRYGSDSVVGSPSC